MAKTRSVLFHPSFQPTHFQQKSSNVEYGSFTQSKPMHSAATGGSRSVFSNTKYDDKPQFSHHVLFQNERIPPFQYTKRYLNQFAFPERLQTPGTIDSAATFISDRITTQYPLYSTGSKLNASSRYATTTEIPRTHSRPTLQSQPSTDINFQGRGTHQQKDKIGPVNSRTDKRGALLRAELLDTYSSASFDPHIHTPYQARNVSFGSSLKTITIYNSPQVSSLAGNLAKQDTSEKGLNDEIPGDVYLESAVDAANSSQKSSKVTSLSRPVSFPKCLSGSDSCSEAFLIKEADKVPSCMAYSSSSCTQDNDHIFSQFQKNNFCRDIYDDRAKTSMTKILSHESNWKVQHKTSSYLSQSLGSEFVLEETKSTDKDTADKTGFKDNQTMEHDDLQVEKLFPISDISAFSSHETGSLPSSRITLHTGSLSNEIDFQPVLAASDVSGTVFASDNKDHNIECVSRNDGSSLPDRNVCSEEAANKLGLISSVGAIPIEEEDVRSEISESGTQTTVQKQEMKIIKNSDRVISDIQDVRENVGKDTAVNKTDKDSSAGVLDVESSGTGQCTFIVPDEVDQNRYTVMTNNQENAQDLVEQQHAKTEAKELSECVVESTKSHEDFGGTSQEQEHDKDQKFTSLETQSNDAAESVADISDQAISVGKQSYKDDSSKDDFW
jgi:hypothetical protein